MNAALCVNSMCLGTKSRLAHLQDISVNVEYILPPPPPKKKRASFGLAKIQAHWQRIEND